MDNVENMGNFKSEEEINQFMQGNPTRLEVANYVNALLETKYMTVIQEQLNALKLGNMVTQALMIQKGVCSGEEIEDMITHLSESFKEDKENKEQTSNNEEQ